MDQEERYMKAIFSARVSVLPLAVMACVGLLAMAPDDGQTGAGSQPNIALAGDDDMESDDDSPGAKITDQQLHALGLCTAAEEAAEQGHGATCAGKRDMSALARYKAIPLPLASEARLSLATPFEMKSAMGVDEATRAAMFSGLAPEDAAEAAALDACGFFAAKGGGVCDKYLDTDCAAQENNRGFCLIRAGYGIPGPHDDQNLSAADMAVKDAAVHALRAARSARVSDSVPLAVAADKAEAAAVLQWQAAGWAM
ncbi:hypothetical protein [Nocardia brasiliensis]|nr:hypothetical protein [Nocardia brasiliensis]